MLVGDLSVKDRKELLKSKHQLDYLIYNRGTQHRTHVRFAICFRVKGLGWS